MLLKIGNICRDHSDHSIFAENLILAARLHLKPRFLASWSRGAVKRVHGRERGVGALERVGWACRRVPRLVLGTQERTFLESPVSVRSAPQGPGSWRTAALLSFRLFIHVQLYGLSFHSHKWTLWPELPFIFARPIGKACNI